MSISSMLGSDAGRDHSKPSRESTSNININNMSPLRTSTRPSPVSQSGSASSPPPIVEGTSFSYHGSQSPERTKYAFSQTSRPSRTFSGGVSRRPFSTTNRDSPDVLKLGSTSSLFSSPYSPTSDTGPHNDWRASQDRRISADRALERPNSQPSGYRTPPLEFEHRSFSRPVASEVGKY